VFAHSPVYPFNPLLVLHVIQVEIYAAFIHAGTEHESCIKVFLCYQARAIFGYEEE